MDRCPVRLALALLALTVTVSAQTQPQPAANPCRRGCQLAGLWNATYAGGPLRVQITVTGRKFTGVLLDGNDFVPAGKSTITGEFDGKTATFTGQQVCAFSGYQNPWWAAVRFRFETPDSFTEDVVTNGCGGFPTHWTRNTNPASGKFTVQHSGSKLDVTVDSAIMFTFNRAELKPQAKAVLAEIKRAVLDPHAQSKILISGYTDDVGDPAYNLRLSEARARSVGDWLQQNGVPADRLVTKGFGKERPKVPNTNAANRAQNRRVEIELTD